MKKIISIALTLMLVFSFTTIAAHAGPDPSQGYLYQNNWYQYPQTPPQGTFKIFHESVQVGVGGYREYEGLYILRYNSYTSSYSDLVYTGLFRYTGWTTDSTGSRWKYYPELQTGFQGWYSSQPIYYYPEPTPPVCTPTDTNTYDGSTAISIISTNDNHIEVALVNNTNGYCPLYWDVRGNDNSQVNINTGNQTSSHDYAWSTNQNTSIQIKFGSSVLNLVISTSGKITTYT